jgi:hypothetical protein
MALLITDTAIGNSQRNALRRSTRKMLASVFHIRPDAKKTIVQGGALWPC